ncbi:pteridine reductase 1-like [Branchiostoma floridae x Branchiostoma japonicum]
MEGACGDGGRRIPVAMVTGSSQRLGACTVKHLHQAGYNVIIHYRKSQAPAEELAQSLNSVRPNSATTLQADLCKGNTEKMAKELIGTAVEKWGRLDVLVNNASDFFPTPMGTVDGEQWKTVMGSNLKAPFFLSQAAIPHLKATKGCIINMADIHGQRPLAGYSVYCIAKAGLIMSTMALAKDLAPDIRVNAVAPGAILWPDQEWDVNNSLSRIPMGRQGSPEDIAKAIVFLVKEAPYVTGQVLPVDGGRSLSQ